MEDFQMTSKQTVESLANDNKTLDIQIKSINDAQKVISYVLILLSYGFQEDDSKRIHRRCPVPMRSSFCWVNAALISPGAESACQIVDLISSARLDSNYVIMPSTDD